MPPAPPAAQLSAWKDVMGSYIRSREFSDQIARLRAQESSINQLLDAQGQAKHAFNAAVLAVGIAVGNFVGLVAYDASGLQNHDWDL